MDTISCPPRVTSVSQWWHPSPISNFVFLNYSKLLMIAGAPQESDPGRNTKFMSHSPLLRVAPPLKSQKKDLMFDLFAPGNLARTAQFQITWLQGIGHAVRPLYGPGIAHVVTPGCAGRWKSTRKRRGKGIWNAAVKMRQPAVSNDKVDLQHLKQYNGNNGCIWMLWMHQATRTVFLDRGSTSWPWDLWDLPTWGH